MIAYERSRKQGLLVSLIVVLAVLFTLTLHQSWQGWFDPIADTGRDLYVPEKMADGEIKLYRDISYLYPPFGPYLLSAIVGIFGSTLGIMTGIGIGVSAFLAILLFALGRRIAGTIGGSVLAFLFITIHMTGVSGYSFNFIFPYSHNAVLGFLSIVLFLYALVRYSLMQGGTIWLWVSLAAGSAAGWSKIEYAATFVILLVASALLRRPHWLPIAIIGGCNTILFSFLSWYFADAPPERHWFTRSVLPESLLSGDVARHYYARAQGLDELGLNAALAVGGALLLAGGVSCLALIDRLQIRNRTTRAAVTFALVIVFAAISFGLAQRFLLFRGFFIIQLLLIPRAVRQKNCTPLFLLLLFSLLLGSRILLRLEPIYYGFLFAIPAEIVMVYLLFEDLPRRAVYRHRFSMLWLPLFFVLGIASLIDQKEVYEKRRENPVTSMRGTFHDPSSDRAEILGDLLVFLQRRAPESMVVIPEGLAINWLTDIPTSIPYHTFNPAELPDLSSQRPIIDAIRSSPSEIILLIRRDYGEYGYLGIGVDYGAELIREIQCMYEPASYRENEGFYVLVMERKRSYSCP